MFLEKLTRKKSDGTERAIPFHASNLMIVDVDKSDARRLGKGKAEKKEVREEKPAKPKEKEKPCVIFE